jgi:hypothetical protein
MVGRFKHIKEFSIELKTLIGGSNPLLNFKKDEIYEFEYDVEMCLYLYNGFPLLRVNFNEHFISLDEYRNEQINKII